MTTAGQVVAESSAEAIIGALLGRKCWHVACGGCVGATFQLALGGKVRRERPLRNPKLPESIRRSEGEFGLMIWCSWQLRDHKGPVTSSADESAGLETGLDRLRGKTICKVSVDDGWYLRVDFSGGLRLSVLPDHVGPEASFDGNWEVWTPTRMYSIETDLTCLVEEREAARQAPRQPRPDRWRAHRKAKARK